MDFWWILTFCASSAEGLACSNVWFGAAAHWLSTATAHIHVYFRELGKLLGQPQQLRRVLGEHCERQAAVLIERCS